MRFNPIISLLNAVGFTRWWASLNKLKGATGKMCFNIATFCWFFVSWLAIPVPVKLTLHIGKPMRPREGETAEELAQRARAAMQEMIDTHQPGGKNYLNALRGR